MSTFESKAKPLYIWWKDLKNTPPDKMLLPLEDVLPLEAKAQLYTSTLLKIKDMIAEFPSQGEGLNKETAADLLEGEYGQIGCDLRNWIARLAALVNQPLEATTQ
jgi:hypothetical protein